MYNFKVKEVEFFPDNPLVLIAGPCLLKVKTLLFMAEKLKEITERLEMPFNF